MLRCGALRCITGAVSQCSVGQCGCSADEEQCSVNAVRMRRGCSAEATSFRALPLRFRFASRRQCVCGMCCEQEGRTKYPAKMIIDARTGSTFEARFYWQTFGKTVTRVEGTIEIPTGTDLSRWCQCNTLVPASSAPRIRMAVHPPPPTKVTIVGKSNEVYVGKILSGHFCFTTFWVPSPPL